MTAAQAQKIIDYLNETNEYIDKLETRVYELEKIVENLKHSQSELTWRDVYNQTKIYEIYKGDFKNEN
jgi:uncharacterized protein YaaN involved in tellurite resistance